MYINTAYEVNVQISYGQLKQMIDWCNRNCTEPWQYIIIDEAGEEPGSYIFRFVSEKDYVTFTLWKK